MTNPYAPPTAIVQDVIDPAEPSIIAERGARLAAAILDSIIFAGMVPLPLMFAVTGGDEAGVISVIGVVLTLIGFGVGPGSRSAIWSSMGDRSRRRF